MVHGLEEIKKNNEDHAAYIWKNMTDSEKKAHPSLNPRLRPLEKNDKR